MVIKPSTTNILSLITLVEWLVFLWNPSPLAGFPQALFLVTRDATTWV